MAIFREEGVRRLLNILSSQVLGLLLAGYCCLLLSSCTQELGTPDAATATDEEDVNGFFIESVDPLVVRNGDELKIYGAKFTDKLTLILGGTEVPTYELISARELRVTVPELSQGKKLLQLKTKRSEARFRLVYAGSTRGSSLIAESDADVCAGETFFDHNGEAKTGTKDCGVLAKAVVIPGACERDGQTECLLVGSKFAAAEVAGLAAKVVQGQTVAGVTGTVQQGTLNLCTGANQMACVATATYRTMDLSQASGMADLSSFSLNTLLASSSSFEFWDSTGTRHEAIGSTALASGNLKSGVSLFGVTGAYPSATYPLPSASATADLDAATFNAKIKSATSFEYWTSSGTYQSGQGDADIDATNIRNGITVFGTTGTVTAAAFLCAYSSEASCIADSGCQWANGACSIDPWNIRIGSSIAGISGSLKTNCRNRVNGALFNGGAAALEPWDTIDDINANGAFPASLVASWTSNTDCDQSVWKDLTADGACNAATDDCLIKDRISGLTWSESYPVSGSAPSSTIISWSGAYTSCDNLVFGSYSDWRLPTQKEWMEAYSHGLRAIGYNGSGVPRATGTLDNNDAFIQNTDDYYWTASTYSYNTGTAWKQHLGHGSTVNDTKAGGFLYMCVRP